MHKYFGSLAAVCLVFAGLGFASPSTAAAQDHPNHAAGTPPNVLVVIREFLKPGKSGAVHEKSEQTFVQAMKQANEQTHYFGLTSLTGKSRALFLLGYDSFADWQKDVKAMAGNSALAQQFDQAQQADGELLTSMDQSVFLYQPDKSVGHLTDLGKVRYWEITRIKVRVGHDDDWDALAKLHDSIYGNMPDARWFMFVKRFGQDSGSMWVVFTPLNSLDELDAQRAAGKKAWAAATADQKKQADSLEASTIESIESNLFAVDPKMSYAADNWKKSDPGFWNQQ